MREYTRKYAYIHMHGVYYGEALNAHVTESISADSKLHKLNMQFHTKYRSLVVGWTVMSTICKF